MTEHDNAFLLELLQDYTERKFAAALRNCPNDETARAAYSDWLEEQGREESASLVRQGFTPGLGWTGRSKFSELVSGSINSGRIASFHIASGAILSGIFSPSFYK